MAEPTTHDQVSPLSWRDVYKAVGDSESRVIAAIEAAIAPVKAMVEGHEERVRSLEINAAAANTLVAAAGSSAATLALAVSVQDSRIKTVENTLLTLTSRGAGVAATFTAAQKVVMVVIGIVGAAATAVAVISQLPT